jgi:long-chain acyl-CoA synthetase
MYPGTFAATTPDKPAVIMGRSREVVTYGELDERSARLAQLLYARGLRPGDKIALLAENHPRFYEVYWAAMRSGLYLTAVNRYLAPAEAAYLVNDSGATVCITTAQMAPTAVPMLELIPDCPIRLMMDGLEDGFESYEAALDASSPEPLDDQPRGTVMLYSSGTTGRPKGIERPLSGLQIDDPAGTVMAGLLRSMLGMTEQSVYLCPAPLYHAAGLQWSAGTHELGGTVVVMEKFDAEQLLVARRARGRHPHPGRPHHARAPDEARSRGPGTLRPLQPRVRRPRRRAVSRRGQAPGDRMARPHCARVLRGHRGQRHDVHQRGRLARAPGVGGPSDAGIPHICDEDGRELPLGETGLIYFEQEQASFEYHGDPEKTRASRHPEHDNWSALGDIGYLDHDGYIYLTDRKAFTIISGGVNIYPAEIEACLIMHPQRDRRGGLRPARPRNGRVRPRRGPAGRRGGKDRRSWPKSFCATPGSTWPATRCPG